MGTISDLIASLRPGYSVVIEPEEGEDPQAALKEMTREVEEIVSLWERRSGGGILGPAISLSCSLIRSKAGNLRIEVRCEKKR